ncbi:MAG: M23 family metallopeptidase [Solirubrobacteraceae bacterium]
MRRTTHALLGAVAAMASLSALLVPVAAAEAGGTPAPSPSGGQEYGGIVSASAPGRPVAARFSVSRSVTAPALPRVVVRVVQPGARSVAARVVFLPQTETGAVVRLDLGRVRVGRTVVASWPSGAAIAPGRYLVRLHVKGAGNTVLARTARATGRTTLVVRAPKVVAPPAPAPAPVSVATGAHAFPVAGPHTYGDGFGEPRNGYSHQGQDVLAAEGTPVVAPVAGTISFTDNQPKAAGYYIVEKGADGYDYFFAHCQEGSTAVAPGATVTAGQPLCRVGHTGDATGPHLHFEVWTGGWRASAASAPIDPLPLLRSWDTPAR